MFGAEKKQLEPQSGIPEIFATEIFRIDLVPGFRMKPIDAILWRHRQKAIQVVGTAGSDHELSSSIPVTLKLFQENLLFWKLKLIRLIHAFELKFKGS